MFQFPGVAALAPKRWRSLGHAGVVGVSLVIGLLTLFLDFEEDVGVVAPIDVVVLAVACALLVGRMRQPVMVAAAVFAARLVMVTVSDTEIALVMASAIAFYNLAKLVPRSVAYGLGAAATLISTLVILAVDTGESFPQEFLGEATSTLLPVALGDAARSRSERLTAIIDAQASSRVQAERLRIARDLHDVVAHGLATIAVQSGTAAYNLDSDDPDDPVRVALERINATGKRSLEDLRDMVGVLRSTDDAPIRPTPTDPDDLSDLIEAAELAEIDLAVEVDGSFPESTAEATIVAAHRIAQEAVTNVARHAGSVDATLELRHLDDRVVLRLVNMVSAPRSAASESTGVGIIGMRERAESVGGTLDARPLNGGGFEVRAELPYRRHDS